MTSGSATSNPGSLKLFNVCQKTKMCRFYAVGTCTRQGQCKFAHSAEELQPAPDLRRTKICPELVKTGSCGNQECIFAHSKDGVRKLNLCRIINSLKKKRGGTIWKSTTASARDDNIDPAPHAVGSSNAVNHNVNAYTTNVYSTMMWSPSPPPPFLNPMANLTMNASPMPVMLPNLISNMTTPSSVPCRARTPRRSSEAGHGRAGALCDSEVSIGIGAKPKEDSVTRKWTTHDSQPSSSTYDSYGSPPSSSDGGLSDITVDDEPLDTMAPPAPPGGGLVVENTFITFKEPREKGARVRSHSWSHYLRPQGLLLGSDAGQNEGFARAVSHGFPPPSASSPAQASCGTLRGSQEKYRESFHYKSAPLLTCLEVTPEVDEPHESLSTLETTPTATAKKEEQGLALRDHRPMDVLPRKLPRSAEGPSLAAPQNIGRQCDVKQFGAGGSGSAWK